MAGVKTNPTGKKPPNSPPYSPLIIQLSGVHFTHHLVSEITALSLPQPGYLHIPVVHGTAGHSGSVQFHHGISLLPPCPGGRCGCSSGGISRYRCVQWHPSVDVVHIQPGTQRLSSYGALHVQPHHLSSSSPRPVRHRTVRPHSGCDNLRLFSGVRRSLLCRLPPVAHGKPDVCFPASPAGCVDA